MYPNISEYGAAQPTYISDAFRKVFAVAMLASVYQVASASPHTVRSSSSISIGRAKSQLSTTDVPEAKSAASSAPILCSENGIGATQIVATDTSILCVDDSAALLLKGPRKYLALALVNVVTETAKRESIAIDEIRASGAVGFRGHNAVSLKVLFSGPSESALRTLEIIDTQIDRWTSHLSSEDINMVFDELSIDFQWVD